MSIPPSKPTQLKDKPYQESLYRKLPGRCPRIQVADTATQQALTLQAETIDSILLYLNTILGSKQVGN